MRKRGRGARSCTKISHSSTCPQVPVKEMLETCLRHLPESVMDSIVGETPVRDTSSLETRCEPFDVECEVFGPTRAPLQREPPPLSASIQAFDEAKSPTCPPDVHCSSAVCVDEGSDEGAADETKFELDA